MLSQRKSNEPSGQDPQQASNGIGGGFVPQFLGSAQPKHSVRQEGVLSKMCKVVDSIMRRLKVKCYLQPKRPLRRIECRKWSEFRRGYFWYFRARPRRSPCPSPPAAAWAQIQPEKEFSEPLVMRAKRSIWIHIGNMPRGRRIFRSFSTFSKIFQRFRQLLRNKRKKFEILIFFFYTVLVV